MDIHDSATPAQIKATLYFGENIPNIGQVHRDAFNQFLEESVVPHFPGFTLTYGQGYWKGQPEDVTILTVLLPDTGANRHQIRIIAEQYKTRFAQEAVAYSFEACQFALDCWPHGPVGAYHRDGKGY